LFIVVSMGRVNNAEHRAGPMPARYRHKLLIYK
jgi:hypothetical protein